MNIKQRLPGKGYLTGLAAHFTFLGLTVHASSWFALALPVTFLDCLHKSGKEQDSNWIKDYVDTKVEIDKTQKWLESQ